MSACSCDYDLPKFYSTQTFTTRKTQFSDQMKREFERRTSQLSRIGKQLEEFERAFGAEIAAGWGESFHALGTAAKAL